MTARIPALLVLLLLTACGITNRPGRLEQGFGAVQAGSTTEAELLTLMGEPARKRVRSIPLVELQTWEYEDERSVYVVTIGAAPIAGAGARVISKELTTKSNTK